MKWRNTLLACLSVVSTSVGAQQIKNGIGLDLRPGYAFSSYRDDLMFEGIDMEGAKTSHIVGSLHLKYSFTFAADSKEGQYYPGVWQGVGVGMNFVGNRKGLGNPVSVYLFQGAPVWHISEKMALYYEWNFGLSAGWKPCDGVTARSNLIVGSKVNAYINIGGGLRWKAGKDLDFTFGPELTHFSNGNTSYPNPGVNTMGIRIGATYSFGRHREVAKSVSADTLAEGKKFGIDFTAYGAWRKRVYRGGDEPVLLKGHFGVVGINVNPMWKVGRIFRIGPSVDVQWDESSDLKRNHAEGSYPDDIRFYKPDVFRQISWGVSARGELVMPLFSVNLGIGYNFIGPEEQRASYQMANLKIRIVKGLYANIGYQLLNFQKQNNLMLGLGWSYD